MRFQRAVEGPDEVALWARIRDAYENGPGYPTELARTFGVTRSAVLWRLKRDGWTRRHHIARGERPTIIKRLLRVLEVQVLHLETEIDEMMKADIKSGEREVQLLGKLAGNLERLMKLDSAASGPSKRRERTAKEIAEMRNKLIKRLEQLQRG